MYTFKIKNGLEKCSLLYLSLILKIGQFKQIGLRSHSGKYTPVHSSSYRVNSLWI